jgi:DNA-directed RNA polymerase specialized sigma24 family protein
MERLEIPHLLDERGQPFDARIERLLRNCIPKLRKQFPTLRNDEFLLTLVLEEGGRRLARWERRTGRSLHERSHRFVWRVVFNVGRSRMLLEANRMQRDTIGAEPGEAILSTLPATTWGTPQQMEAAVRLRETHDHLPEDQWSVLESKIVGYSAAQIGEKRGCSADAVNMVFSRAKRKLRALLGPLPADAAGGARGAASPGAVPEPSAHNRGDDKHADGQLAPAPRLVCVHRRE